MGLDIYFYRVRKSLIKDNDSIEKIINRKRRAERKRFNKTWNRYMKRLSDANRDYRKDYDNLIEYLKKQTDWSYQLEILSQNVLSISQLKEWKKTFWIDDEELYYRKVNFLFKFFSDHEKMIDNVFCEVSRDSILELLESCDKVLEHEGETITDENNFLPTTSGFFFGSISYDNWYYQDVREVQKDFKKLAENLKEGDRIFGYFSY